MDDQSTFGHNWNEMKPIFAFSAAITAMTLCTPAEARQAEAVLHVSAVVEESCSASADPLDFVLDTTVGASAHGQASIDLSCSGPTAFEIALDTGQNGARRMLDSASGQTLAYEIYSDAARNVRWGNASGVDTVAGAADANGKATLTAYGSTFANVERVAAGTYSDAVAVTVNF